MQSRERGLARDEVGFLDIHILPQYTRTRSLYSPLSCISSKWQIRNLGKLSDVALAEQRSRPSTVERNNNTENTFNVNDMFLLCDEVKVGQRKVSIPTLSKSSLEKLTCTHHLKLGSLIKARSRILRWNKSCTSACRMFFSRMSRFEKYSRIESSSESWSSGNLQNGQTQSFMDLSVI